MARLTLAEIKRDTASLFLCEGGSDGDHATLVRGWDGLLMEYATTCIDYLDPRSVLGDAEIQLAEPPTADEWTFGANGTAILHIAFEDGWWRCSRVTTTPALAIGGAADLPTQTI